MAPDAGHAEYFFGDVEFGPALHFTRSITEKKLKKLRLTSPITENERQPLTEKELKKLRFIAPITEKELQPLVEKELKKLRFTAPNQ